MPEAAKAKKPDAQQKVQTMPAAAVSHAPAMAGPAWAAHSVAGPSGMVQRKVAIGEPGDAYEQEADAAAAKVTAGGSVPMMSISQVGAASLSRAPMAGKKESDGKAVQKADKKDGEKKSDGKAVQKADKKDGEKKSDGKAVQKADKKDGEKKSDGKAVQKADAKDGEKKSDAKAVQKADKKDGEKKSDAKAVQKADAKDGEKKSDGKAVQKADAKDGEKKSDGKAVQKADAKDGEKKSDGKAVQKADAKDGEKKSDGKAVQKADKKDGEKKSDGKAVQKADKKDGEKKSDAKAVQKADKKDGEKKQDAKAVQKADKKDGEKKQDAKAVQKAIKKDTMGGPPPMAAAGAERQGAAKAAAADEKDKEPAAPEAQAAPQVQRSTVAAAPAPAPETTAANAIASKGAGTPLAPTTRSTLEQGFGTDLSHVRVHDDARAQDAASALSARAFTHQNDIWLGRGESQSDTQLMAHETTHVIQQSNSVQRELIQRALVQRGNKPAAPANTVTEDPTGVFKASNGTIVDTTGGAKKKITIPELELPGVANKMEGITSPFKLPPPTPRANQREKWRSAIKGPGVDSKPDTDLLTPDKAVPGTNNTPVWYLRLNKDKGNNYLVGDKASLKERLKLPNWFGGERTNLDVDHVRELQLGGADDITNYQMLDASANRSSGSKIDKELTKKIQSAITPNVGSGKAWTSAPSVDEVRQKDEITFTTVKNTMTINGDPSKVWKAAEVGTEGKHLASLEAMSTTEIEKAGLRDDPTKLKLFLWPGAGMPRELDWPAGSTSISPGKVAWNMPGLDITNVSFTPGGSGKLTAQAWKDNKVVAGVPLSVDIAAIPGLQYTAVASGSSLRQKLGKALKAEGASPIEIFDADLGPKGIMARGVIRPDISILKGTEIDILIEGNDVTVSKTFSGGDLKLPGPIKVTGGTLTISAGTKGLELDAGVTFLIEKVGHGSLNASTDMASGFEIKGEFNFDTTMFNPAVVNVSYKRMGDGEGEWSGSGKLGIPANTIKGIKKADINAAFEKGVLSAKGNVELDVPGIKEGSMEASFSEADGISIGGKFTLADNIPGISGGSIEAKVQQKGDGWAVTAKGSATPKIPGVNATLTVAYEDGAITIEGQAAYEKGMLKGSVLIGATNKPVGDDGRPGDGPGGKQLRAYGGGTVTIKIAPWLQGTVGIKLLPNGEIEVSGEVSLPGALDIFPEKKVEKNIFSINLDIPIVGVSVAGQRIGIFATIGGGLTADAGIGPGQLTEAKLGVTYNPAHEDQTHVYGAAKFHVPAHAGLRLFVRGGLGAGIPIVSATAGLEVGGSIGLEGAADASVNVDWTPAKGLVLDVAGEIFVEPKFKFDITGYVTVDADLLFTTVNLYEKRWQLAGFEWGSGMRFGVRFPIHYEEGKPFDVKLSDVEFIAPNISAEDVLNGLISQIA